jgi:hypothetical protein
MKYTFVVAILISAKCIAQSTPSEFAEMNFQELFNQSLYETSSERYLSSPWLVGYQTKSVKFEGYLEGSKSLSFDDVLWNGPSEIRTSKNFPVLPTIIYQKAHVISLGYQFSPSWQAQISIPHLKQKTDHTSIVSNYNFFIIETEGVGDVAVSANYNWNNAGAGVWGLSFGITLPTGSIDKLGDTPRAAGDQELPYTMQLGSGTYDFPIELSYKNQGSHDFSVSLSANIRTGYNSRNYRLGNNYSLKGRYQIELSSTLRSYAELGFRYSDTISGQDDSLLVNAPFPYPASITNPKFYGGKKIDAGLGLSWKFAKDYQLTLEIGKPLYQYLNGPQPKEQWRNNISLSKLI